MIIDAHPKTKKWMRDSFRAQFQEMVLTSKEVKLEEAERDCQAEEDAIAPRPTNSWHSNLTTFFTSRLHSHSQTHR
jgi:hypothetical protein